MRKSSWTGRLICNSQRHLQQISQVNFLICPWNKLDLVLFKWLKWFCLLGRISGLVSILFYLSAIYLCHAPYAWIQTVFQIIFVIVISHVPFTWCCFSVPWDGDMAGKYRKGHKVRVSPGLPPLLSPAVRWVWGGHFHVSQRYL